MPKPAPRRHPAPRLPSSLTALTLLILLGATTTHAQIGVAPSPWWKDVEYLGKQLASGKNKQVAKAAPKLAHEILGLSWIHPDLPAIFAELALYEAVALVYLDDQATAIWRWHTALNIDPKLASRDLAPFGEKAADLFREYPLRRRGEVPYRWSRTVHGPITGTSLVPPRKVDEEPPVVLHSSGARSQGADRPLLIEMILDESGKPHQPVVVMPIDPHPAVVWAVLRWIPHRTFAPGSLDGETRPFLFSLEVAFKVLRGASETKRQ